MSKSARPRNAKALRRPETHNAACAEYDREAALV